MRTTNLLAVLSLLIAGAIAGCAPEGDEDVDATNESLSSGACASSRAPYKAWCLERTKRRAALDAYVADHAADGREFTEGAFSTQGIPLILFKLLPDLLPDIWGTPQSQMAIIGMGPNPYDAKAAVPLGFATSQTPVSTPLGDIHITGVTFSCSYCHVGRVEDDNGRVLHLLGAPSTQNVNILIPHRATAASPVLTAANLRAKLLTKPIGWLFPNDPTKLVREVKERAFFLLPGVAEKVIDQYRQAILGAGALFDASFGAHTYAVANAPNPASVRRGVMDSIDAAIFPKIDPRAFPQASDLAPAPAEVDMMAAWRQADRPNSHWDGALVNKLFRNAAAALGTVANPATEYRTENAYATTAFTDQLPSPPYPFDVDMAKAGRGKVSFQKYCSSCHAAGGEQLFTPAEVGTDPNRAEVLKPYGIARVIATTRAGLCRTATDCKNPDGTDLRDDQIISPTGAYVALPLTGVWATAPYLHNGSVPTLRALMTGDRPAKFYRGNIAYDKRDVGFVSDVSTAQTTEYDTSLSGFANTGHTGTKFLGDVDWKAETQKLDDLLEYMKTL